MARDTSFMPFYPGDYLADTGHLSTVDHGAYLLLLMHAWTHGGIIPGDKKQLQMITKSGAKKWLNIAQVVMPFFDQTEDGFYTHKRVTQELGRRAEIIEKRRVAGQKGGRPAKANGFPEESKPKANAKQASRVRGNPHPQPQEEKKLSSREKKKSGVPEEFCLSAALMAWLAKERVPIDRAEGQIEAFLDHHRAANSKMADWDAAFRTWIRNGIQWERIAREPELGPRRLEVAL